MSESQSVIVMDESQVLVSPEIDYAEMVEAYQKDHRTTNLITQRIHITNQFKEVEEEKLDSIKETCSEVESDNEKIKNQVVEHSMLVNDWITCASEKSQLEVKVKVLKQLEEEEIKLHEDQLKRLEELNGQYVFIKASFESAKLQGISNNLSEALLLLDEKIAKAEVVLKKMQEFNSDTHADMDSISLNVICEELLEEFQYRKKRIQSMKEHNEVDQQCIEKLKAEIDRYKKI